jgi:hypothetical protein
MKPKERVNEGGPWTGQGTQPLSWFWIAYFALDSTVNVFPAFNGFDHFQQLSVYSASRTMYSIPTS